MVQENVAEVVHSAVALMHYFLKESYQTAVHWDKFLMKKTSLVKLKWMKKVIFHTGEPELFLNFYMSKKQRLCVFGTMNY